MNDKRVGDGATFGDEYFPASARIECVCRQAVNGFGGDADELPGSQAAGEKSKV